MRVNWQALIIPGLVVSFFSLVLTWMVSLRVEISRISAKVEVLESRAERLQPFQQQVNANQEAIAILKGIVDQARFDREHQ